MMMIEKNVKNRKMRKNVNQIIYWNQGSNHVKAKQNDKAMEHDNVERMLKY